MSELERLRAEVGGLRQQLSRRAGLVTMHYSAEQLSVLYGTTPRFWLDLIHSGELGAINAPGGPVNITPRAARPTWRIPGDSVRAYLETAPVPAADTTPTAARTPGELIRRAA